MYKNFVKQKFTSIKLFLIVFYTLFTATAQTFDISNINGVNGILLKGIDTNDKSGFSVSGAGDINGDGVDDIIIGAPDADPNGNSLAGESYLVFGKSSGFTNPIELSALNGTNGVVIEGIDANDFSGYSVTAAGDFNNDGFDDLFIGADSADPGGNSGAGEAYVVFGKGSAFSTPLDPSTLDGSTGFTIFGQDAGDNFALSVSDAGDINNDGISDIIAGAYRGDPGGRSNAGKSYVIFGSSGAFASTINVSTLDGNNGFTINGIDASDYSGVFVNSCGDVNGDAIDDIIIGADWANGTVGESYVVFGDAGGFAATLELSSLDGTNGFQLNGIDAGDQAGYVVSGAGDINGDGINDLLIAAYNADPGGKNSAGEVYVLFGSSSPFAASINLSSLDGTNGFIINGEAADDRAGFSASNAGDFNNDGFDDIIVGAYLADPGGNNDAGKAYVVYGKNTAFAASLELSSLNGTNGITINGSDAGDLLSFFVESAGDVNGDGVTDIIIGAPGAASNGNSGAGETYVLFGHVAPTVTTSAATAITKISATGNGEITSLGTDTITEYGVCWNTTGTPTTADSKTNEGSKTSVGTFTGSITGLSSWTTYYVRSYATNSHGTSYGNQVSFTTVNNAPTVAVPITDTTVTEDFPTPILYRDLNAVFSDVEEGSALTFTVNSFQGLVTPSVNGDSVLVLTAVANANGIDSIEVTATDGGALAVIDTVIITVTAQNDVPTVAAPITDTTVTEDFPTPILYRDLNAVFTDVEEGSALTFTVNSLQGLVTPSVNVDSVLVLTAVANANGLDSIEVTATDGGALAVIDTVIITVTAQNDAPTVAVPITDTTVTEDFPTPIFYRDLNAVFSDVEEGSALTFTVNSLQGVVTPGVNGDSVLVLTAVANANGLDSIEVTATDGGALAVIDTVIITVTALNDAPTVAVPITDTTVTEDFPTPILYRDLNAVFSDVEEGSALTFTVNSFQGLVTPAVNGDSVLALTAVTNANGLDSIEVTATDGGALAVIDTVIITVTAQNDAPTVAVPITDTTVTEDFPTPILYRDLNAVFTDVEEGSALTFTVNSLQGLVTPSVNVDSVLVLTAVANSNGLDSIEVTATDGGALVVIDTVIITVTAQNDAPTVAVPITDTTVTEDFPTPILYRDLNAVFTDVEEGSALTFTVNSLQGLVTPSVNVDSVLVLTAVVNANGLDSIEVTATDGGALVVIDTVIITVTAQNDAPTVAVPITDTTVTEDFPTPILYRDLNAVFSDVEEGSALTFTVNSLQGLVTPSVNVDSVLVLTAVANANGLDSIEVTATDGGALAVIDTVIITVTAQNDAPAVVVPITDTTVTEDFPTPIFYRDLNAVFSDVEEGSALTFTVNSLQGVVTPGVNGDSVLVLTAVANANGLDSIEVTAIDGGALAVIDTVIITVTAQNDAPTVAVPITDTTVTEDFTPILYRDLNSVFYDVEEGTALTFYSARSLYNKTILSINEDTILVISSIPNYYGVDTLEISARDAGAISIIDTVAITIAPQNDTPAVVIPINDTTVPEDFTSQILYRDLNDIFADIEDGTTLNFSVSSLQNNVNVAINSDSVLVISAIANANGIDSLIISATDNGTLTAYDTVVITVTPINDAPTQTITIPDTTLIEDFTPAVTYRDLNAIFADIEDGTALSFSAVSLQNRVLPSISSDSVLVLKSVADSNGIDTVIISATDNGALSISDTITITIQPDNDSPYIVNSIPDTVLTKNFLPLSYKNLRVVFNDIENGTNLSFASYSQNEKVHPAIINDSLLTFTSYPGITGTDTVIITASDPEGLLISDTISINVIPSPNSPAIVSPIPDTTLEEDFSSITYRDLSDVFNDIEDGSTLAYSVISLNGILSATLDNSKLVFTSLINSHGEDTIICQAVDSDGLLVLDTAVIKISEVNDAPSLSYIEPRNIPEDSEITLDLSMTDANDVDISDELFLLINPGVNYTVSGTTISPALNFNGTILIPIRVRDNLDTSAAVTFTLTVDPVNDAPTLSGAFPQIITYESQLSVDFTMLENPVDPDNTPVIVILPGNNYSVQGVTITPDREYIGDLSVPIYLDDGVATSETVTMMVTVVAPNEPPVITDVIPCLIEQDKACTLKMENITVIDNDPDDNISVSILPGDNYSVSNNILVPSPGFFGILKVSMRAFDGTDYSDTYFVDVEVRELGTNSVPVLNSVILNEIEKNSSIVLTPGMVDMYDNDRDHLSFIILPGENYSVSGSQIQPDPGFIGEIEVPVMVSDGIDNSEIVYSSITVFERVVDFNNGIITKETGGVSINIFPNPARSDDRSMTISSEMEDSEKLDISIFDPVGNKLIGTTVLPDSENRYQYQWNFDQTHRGLGGSYIIYFRFYRGNQIIAVDKQMVGIVR